MPDGEGVEDQPRRDQQRDLRAAADGDLDRQRHLVATRGGDGRVVLGGVANERDDDDADEELGEPEPRQRRLHRADQHLRLHRRQDGADRKERHRRQPVVSCGESCVAFVTRIGRDRAAR